jgi:hypothetical protein
VLALEELCEEEAEQRGIGRKIRNFLEGFIQPCHKWTELVGRRVFCMNELWVRFKVMLRVIVMRPVLAPSPFWG